MIAVSECLAYSLKPSLPAVMAACAALQRQSAQITAGKVQTDADTNPVHPFQLCSGVSGGGRAAEGRSDSCKMFVLPSAALLAAGPHHVRSRMLHTRLAATPCWRLLVP